MSKAKLSVALIGIILFLLPILIGGIPWADTFDPSNRSSFLLERSVISSGGCPGAGPVGTSNGTLGQPTPTGEGLAGERVLRTGFWAWPPGTVSGLANLTAQPLTDCLFQNFPNPLAASTTIEYTLSGECMVSMSVFNVQGQRVRTLVSESQVAGRHFAVWDGRDDAGVEASPGIYFYRLDAGDQKSVKKMVLAR